MSNDDIGDDFDTDDFDLGGFDDDGLEGFDNQNSLADLWKNNPIVKIAVIAAGALLLVVAVMFVGGGEEDIISSRVTRNSEVNELPGTSELSPAMEEALQEENNRRLENARKTGGSTLPMPIDPPQGQISMQFEEKTEEDPLERWRQMQEERLRNEQVTEAPIDVAPVAPVDTRTPAVNALSEAMATQMEAILNSQGIPSIQVKSVSPEDYLENLQEEERKKQQALLEQAQQNIVSGENLDGESVAILVPAGTIEYAQMVTEANTDAPGPILAQIASGPLKGARLIGSFNVSSDANQYLTLNFNTVVLDGISYSVDAIAIDPNTTLPGVATDVDQRYLQRVALPTAAAFIKGLTEAISQSGATTITISDSSGTTTQQSSDLNSDQEVASGIAEAGETISEILEDRADLVEPLIRVRVGTPIGILFTSPVFDKPVTSQSSGSLGRP